MTAALVLVLCGCSARHYREKVDSQAYEIIAEKQEQALGEQEEFTVERPVDTLRRKLLLGHDLPYAAPGSLGSAFLPKPPHWPEEDELLAAADLPALVDTNEATVISLVDALQVAAANSREYQAQKEGVFLSALGLEFERDQFRMSFAGVLSGLFNHDRSGLNTEGGTISESVEASAIGDASKVFKNGSVVSMTLGLNLLKMLEPGRFTSESMFGDASVSIPLMRGSGRHIVTEPLNQAERDVVYALFDFEHFKRGFAVRIASEYLQVLQRQNAVENAAENYRGLISSSRRARRLLDFGRLPAIQVDQSIQEELSARNRWVSARESFASAVDQFKISLGLPPDAPVVLASEELEALRQTAQQVGGPGSELDLEAEIPPADAPIVLDEPSTKEAGPLEVEPERAIRMALENRLDLENAIGRVHDAQRRIVVAADRLRPELTLFGSAAYRGEEAKGLRPDRGNYTALLEMDLPFERTAEAIAYRRSYISLEAAVRQLQALEDDIKLAVLDRLRELREARESLRIQTLAEGLASRRVVGARLNLDAGRVEIRDLLEAQADLLAAQNALTAAAVGYRVAQLSLQRDLGILKVDSSGMWTEVENLEE